LIENKNLRLKLGNAARRLMVENYDWNVTHRKIEQMYIEALETGVSERRCFHSFQGSCKIPNEL
jgi:hypothetical protein